MKEILNLNWYNAEQVYSDGDIEKEIYTKLVNGLTETELLRQDDRWPVIYHFSPLRQNIVRWLPLSDQADVLEIGSGMGAITNTLCQKAGHVTCIELSLLRSQINALRNQNVGNLDIIVANLNDVPVLQKYDLVTLIGVLEYSGRYTDGPAPYADFLKKACSYVKKGGQLVVAIENRLGLKYFAGAKEDHYGIPFYGLNNYPVDNGIRTFSLPELKDLLATADCTDYELYLPFPDYKFPTAIVAADDQEYFSSAITDEFNYGGYIMESFDQSQVFASLIRQNTFQEFTNSFLVVIKC